MPQIRRKRSTENRAQRPARPRSRAARQNRRSAIILASVVIVLILTIVGVSVYPTYIAPFRIKVITVNNINIRMDYFIKRIRMASSDPITMLSQLTNDQIVKLGAPQFGIQVSPADIDEQLKSTFQGSTSENISQNFPQAEYNEWYRQLLNESRISNAEYRDMIGIQILRDRLQQRLADNMSTTAEEIHVYEITLNTLDDANKARARWEAGEPFTDLAKELSLDTDTGQNGGELGWFPKGGVLSPEEVEYAAFELNTGNVSAPLPITSDVEQADGSTEPTVVGYWLIWVSERANRELDDNALEILKGQLVDNWISSVRQNYNIVWRGLKGNTYDSETNAWINWQIAKSPSSTTSTSSASQ